MTGWQRQDGQGQDGKDKMAKTRWTRTGC